MKQPDLFGNSRPSRVPGAAQREPARRAEIEFFDFERDGDATRCVPQPGAVIPEEIQLVTDDPAWVPKGRFG